MFRETPFAILHKNAIFDFIPKISNPYLMMRDWTKKDAAKVGQLMQF